MPAAFLITALVNSKEFDKEGKWYIEALDNHQSAEDSTVAAEQGANVNITDEGIKRAENMNAKVFFHFKLIIDYNNSIGVYSFLITHLKVINRLQEENS